MTCFYQAILVLVWFRQGEDKTTLGAGFGVSKANAHRYVAEAVRVLAAQTPTLHDALARVAADGWSHVTLDGKLVRHRPAGRDHHQRQG
ncbi:transposase family protein [Salinispora mooreana]|uniref:transposase family protein n=1 Tax=Salinispora mooreana TaxID=999545 RepID=UPI000366614E|nr:transposase family protein [Salinispora mooreana]